MNSELKVFAKLSSESGRALSKRTLYMNDRLKVFAMLSSESGRAISKRTLYMNSELKVFCLLFFKKVRIFAEFPQKITANTLKGD